MQGQRQHKGAMTVFSTNGAGASRCSKAKEKKKKNIDTDLTLFTNMSK